MIKLIYFQTDIIDFVGMSIDKNVRVGCAGVWYPENGIGRVNFACNYAVKPTINLPIYIEGSVASKCKTGRDSQYPGLCSITETYDQRRQ